MGGSEVPKRIARRTNRILRDHSPQKQRRRTLEDPGRNHAARVKS